MEAQSPLLPLSSSASSFLSSFLSRTAKLLNHRGRKQGFSLYKSHADVSRHAIHGSFDKTGSDIGISNGQGDGNGNGNGKLPTEERVVRSFVGARAKETGTRSPFDSPHASQRPLKSNHPTAPSHSRAKRPQRGVVVLRAARRPTRGKWPPTCDAKAAHCRPLAKLGVPGCLLSLWNGG
jgi:hypothetical protein